jgi:NAD(P)H-hydrate epimerase
MVLGTEDDEFAESRIDALLERATAVVVGPGLGRGQWGSALWRRLRASLRADSKVLVDADALYFLADEEQISKSSKQQWVLTPHPGEAAMMLGESVATVQADRFASVQALNKRYGASALLKGAGSLLCLEQDFQFTQKHRVRTLLCTEGNPGMATGGMGDVLAGTVGALMGQGLSGPFGLEFGVALHGEAGDLAAQRCGERGLRASDLMPELRRLLNPLEAPGSAPEL